jgi:hypothetical protein
MDAPRVEGLSPLTDTIVPNASSQMAAHRETTHAAKKTEINAINATRKTVHGDTVGAPFYLGWVSV